MRTQARRAISEEPELRDSVDREDRLDAVDSGVFGALAELIDPEALLDGIDGVESLGAITAARLTRADIDFLGTHPERCWPWGWSGLP